MNPLLFALKPAYPTSCNSVICTCKLGVGRSKISTQLFSFQRSLPNKELGSKKKKKKAKPKTEKKRNNCPFYRSIGNILAGQIIKI